VGLADWALIGRAFVRPHSTVIDDQVARRAGKRESSLGLKDLLGRMGGKKPAAQRGGRGARQQKRDRAEFTQEMSVPPAQAGWPGAGESTPGQPVRQQPRATAPVPPQPAPHQPVPPPSAQAQRAQTPPPPHAEHAAQAPSSNQVSASQATMIHQVPQLSDTVGVIVGVNGKFKNKTFLVKDGENTIGREETNSIQLLDMQISRQHAKILHQDGVLVLSSLKPENPVVLNGEPIGEADQLSDGDKLCFGDSTFHFRTIEGP
jgi:hypothetical protein